MFPRTGPKLASPQRQPPLKVTAPEPQLSDNKSVSASRCATPSHAAPPPPPPPPPPLPPSSTPSVSAHVRSRMGNAQLPPTDTPLVASVSFPHSNPRAQAVQSQSDLSQEQLSASPSTSAGFGDDIRARYGRQPSARLHGSLAADAGQQAASCGMPRLQPPPQLPSQQATQSRFTQGSNMQQSEQQQGWQHQPDRSAETEKAESIAAVHASRQRPASGAFSELQSGVKKRWPTVQSNPLYQQADAGTSTVLASDAVTSGDSSRLLSLRWNSCTTLYAHRHIPTELPMP